MTKQGVAAVKRKQETPEAAILAIILMDNDVMFQVAGVLMPEHFQLKAYRILYREMLALHLKGAPLDADTLKKHLKMKEPGDAAQLCRVVDELEKACPKAQLLSGFIEAVRTRFLEDQVEAATALLTGSKQKGKSALERAAQAIEALEKLMGPVPEMRWQPSEELARNTLHDIAGRRDLGRARPEAIVRMPFIELHRYIPQLEGRQFAVLASFPGEGKTAFASSLALKLAGAGHGVAYISTELPADMLMLRLAAAKSHISLNRILKGSYNDTEYIQLANGIDEVSRMPLHIMAPPMLSPRALRYGIQRLKEQHDIKLVVVDSLELIHQPGHPDRDDEILAIYRELRTLCRESDVFVLLLSPLRPIRDRRLEHHPGLVDLPGGESAQILPDVILALYGRHTSTQEYPERLREVELAILKNRMGSTGRILLAFLSEFVEFVDHLPV